MISKALCNKNGVTEILVHTGQHYDNNMSDVFFNELEIPIPDYNLGIGSGTHGQNTGRMIEAIEKVLLGEKPDWVLVYGDTNTTLAGALAASKLKIHIAHVEAGLRSFNRTMPEEINRILTDHASDILFVPTETAVKNLLNEGIEKDKIKLVGDVMYDAVIYYSQRIGESNDILDRLGMKKKKYILATIHRQENTDYRENLGTILYGLELASLPTIFPLHPRTKKQIEKFKIGKFSQIHLIEPVSYIDMIDLERQAAVIATDSGGVQKEAYFKGVPCLTLRSETEWTELIEIGWNVLADMSSAEGIADSINMAMSRTGKPKNLFGDGKSAEKIVDLLY